MGFFSLGKESKPRLADMQTVARTQAAVTRFFEQRQVENFKVYVVLFDGQPIVLVKAQPQRKLRYSNILEIQIRQFVKENLGIEIPAVFWRFRNDYSDAPSPEQADYDAEPDYAEDPTPSQLPVAITADAGTEATEKPADDVQPVEDLRLLKQQSIAVEEISIDEFEQFLGPTDKPES